MVAYLPPKIQRAQLVSLSGRTSLIDACLVKRAQAFGLEVGKGKVFYPDLQETHTGIHLVRIPGGKWQVMTWSMTDTMQAGKILHPITGEETFSVIDLF